MDNTDRHLLENTAKLFDTAIAGIGQVIPGKNEQIKLALCCLLARGYYLIED